MAFLDITSVWITLAWIALAFATAWLLTFLAERDSAASEPDEQSRKERENEAEMIGLPPAEAAIDNGGRSSKR
jgi:hypothetical protein